METLKILLRDSRFWAAVLVLVNTVLLLFPADVSARNLGRVQRPGVGSAGGAGRKRRRCKSDG